MLVSKVHRQFDLYVYAEYDAGEIITKRFIKEGASEYGVLVGREFLYAIGYADEEPDTVTIISSRLDQQIVRFDIGGKKYLVKKSRCPITDANKAVFPIFELFNNTNRVIDKKLIQCCSRYIGNSNIRPGLFEEYRQYYPKAYQRIRGTKLLIK